MNENDFLITVYITNYNYGHFINQAIESVLNQSIQSFELIIIDDGSVDNSKNIIEKYRNTDNVRIIYQKNKGLNVTNNIALNLSKGKYIIRLDADDYLETNALELMVSVMEKDKQLGLVFPDYFYVDINGNKIGEERRHDFDKDVAVFDQPAHGACTMVRTEFLKKLGGYNEAFSCQDGYDLWIKFVTNHKVSNINKPLFSYRRHGNNLTNNELRILQTRQLIKRDFVKKNNYKTSTLLILPIKPSTLIKNRWILNESDEVGSLIQKIKTCSNAKLPNLIVVTSSSEKIQTLLEEGIENTDKIKFIERPEELEQDHIPLAKTIEHVSKSIDEYFDNVMTVDIEYPFLKHESIDEAIDTMMIFNADSVVSVRPDYTLFYKHNGKGMKPFSDKEQFTKYEREAIYKASGGIMLSKLEQVIETGKSISGKVAHIIIDEKASFNLKSKINIELFRNFNIQEYLSK